MLTEHRQFNAGADYRALEDKFGLMVLKASEVETDYGHVLVFGVTDEMTQRFDFANVRLRAQELIDEVARMGGVAVPCHPGRPTVGLYEHYADQAAARERGRSRGPQRRLAQGRGRSRRWSWCATYGYRAVGGSDSHLVSLIALCATRFEADVRSIEDLVRELKDGQLRAGRFPPQAQTGAAAVPDEVKTQWRLITIRR